MEKQLQAYHTALSKKFYSIFAKTNSQKTEEDLHSLRVIAKKLLAFYDLMAVLDDEFPLKKVRKPIRAFMKQTSLLRNEQVSTEIAKEAEEYLVIQPKLSERLEAASISRGESSFRTNKKFSLPLMQLNEERVAQSMDKLRGRVDVWVRLHHYFHDETDWVRRLAETILRKRKEKAVHAFRITLKSWMYNLFLLKKLTPSSRGLKPLLDQLDDFQELLGDWNDMVVFAELMKKDALKVPSKLKRLAKKECRRLLAEIIRRLEKFPTNCLEIQGLLYALFSKPPYVQA